VVWFRLGTHIVWLFFWRECVALESVRIHKLFCAAVSSLASYAFDCSSVHVEAQLAVWLCIGTLLADLLSVALDANFTLLVVITRVRKWKLWRNTVAQLVHNLIWIFANTMTFLHGLVNLASKRRIRENGVLRIGWIFGLGAFRWLGRWFGEVWAGLSEAGLPLGEGSFHASLSQFEVSVGYGSW
jgi:hypothetical protein